MKTPESGSLIPSLVLALAVSAASADDLYVNDFSTRTSQDPIPAIGVWQTAQPYPAKSAFLCVRHSANAGTFDAASLASYFDDNAEGGFGRPSVDGWFLPYFNDNYKLVPRYLVPGNSEGLADSPVLTFSYGVTTTARYGYAIHPIHNEFTNGQLRVQVDLKAPVRWAAKSSWFKVFPVYRKYMDVLAWGNSQCDTLVSPGKFGFRATGGNAAADLLKTFPQYYDSRNSSSGTTQVGNNYSPSYTYWYRFVVTYDLDAKTFFGDLYKLDSILGGSCPTLDTETPETPTISFGHSGDSKTVEGFMADPSAATGGIAGIGFAAYGNFTAASSGGLGCTTNKVFADNIRLSWKAPGASDFEVFYENDFETRRYRTLCAPAPAAATGAYAQSTAAVAESDTFSGYAATTTMDSYRLVRTTVNNTLAQPVGIDGWRKLPYYAKMNGTPAVVNYGGNADNDPGGTGGNMLTYGDQSGVSRLVQTLGSSFSSGMVRIAADVRIPRGNNHTTELPFNRRLGIGLGSAALYEASRADVPAELAGGFGYERTALTGDCQHRPFTVASGSSGSSGEPTLAYPTSFTSPESNSWYRIEVAADLGTKKYGVTVTPIGAASVTADDVATGQPIFEAAGLDFAGDISDIGAFYLNGYGYGSSADKGANMPQRVCWDNIRVWHDDDLVYENDFTTRTRTLSGVTRETGYLAALQYNLDGGQDHWVRRDYTGPSGFDARAWVRDEGGNPFLALGRSSEAGRTITLVNGLGLSQTKPFRFEADIRPPSQWSAASGSATISLGDSQMLQTEAPESFYGAHRLVSFGFDGTNTANQAGCPYYFAGCKAQVGGTALDADIDETHWYRFRLDVDPEDGICDAKLYDMGTTHPTAETKGGTLAATATDITFENALAAGEGVSTILIEGDGLSGAVGSLGVDPAHVLIDNLRLSVPTPFTLVIR